MLWGSFAGKGTGALQKVDSIIRKEDTLEILRQPLKTSHRKLKLGSNYVFQQANDTKHTYKVLKKMA